MRRRHSLKSTARVWFVVALSQLILASITFAKPAAGAAPRPAPAVDFSRDVYPILQKSCFECHGPKKHKAGLRLDGASAALRGGTSGPAIVPGQALKSELYRRITLPKGQDDAMPPRGEPLSTAQTDVLRDWINQGAKGPATVAAARHWAYVPPVRPLLPPVRSHAEHGKEKWVRNAIDHFILARLEREGLRPSPEAERATLLRRLYLDLIGLPPSPAEVDRFLGDTSPQAYERLVDRLLASPQFGVRWARPWLDCARYADSHGFQKDDFRDLWPYRDWVVNALNADMPFDRFTIEQLAGDLLPGATEAQQVATGFNRCVATNVEAGSEPEETRVNQVFDRVNTLGTVWLGTTLECTQCHDHKYDPFTMRDYYGLFAFFNNTAIEAERSNPQVPSSIAFLGPSLALKDSRIKAEQARLKARLDDVNRWLADHTGPLPKYSPQWEAALPQSHADFRLQPDPEFVQRRRERDRLDAKLRKLKPLTTLVMRELPRPRASAVFLRGNYRTPGEKVMPAAPAVLPPLDVPPGRRDRLDLARWLVRHDNPLTARVAVNRWWAELFGHGLVLTAEDFGVRGEPPTHPRLLDWLAVEFVENGWSMKRLLRTIVTSATYRQASRMTPDLLARDDRNLLYARGPRFRMDAEMIRDNALVVAGLLNPALGGPPIRPYQPAGVWVKIGGQRYDYVVSPGAEKYRRGLYVVWKRGAAYPSFVNFDADNRMMCRVKRPRSNTPLQALTLLNDPVYVETAMAFARRMLREKPDASAEERIAYAFRLAVARTPHADEVETLKRLLETQRQAAGHEPDAARRFVGKFTLPAGIPAEEFVAWYAVATALLNLDETISIG